VKCRGAGTISWFVALDLDMCRGVRGSPKECEVLSVSVISFAAISAGEQNLNTAEVCLLM